MTDLPTCDSEHDLILVDWRTPVTNILETRNTSQERVGFMIDNVLNMRKLSAKWVPKCSNSDKKRKIKNSYLVLGICTCFAVSEVMAGNVLLYLKNLQPEFQIVVVYILYP